jgi:hypothetical protein
MSTYDRAPGRWNATDTVAGFLATISIFASVLALVYRPVRILPFSILLVLIAARMSSRYERLTVLALVTAVVCWTVGMTIAVVTENPLW